MTHVTHVNMQNVTLFLPDSTYDILNDSAKTTGIDLAHFCSSVLTDFAANRQVVEQGGALRNGKRFHIFKKSDNSKPDKTIPQMKLVEEIVLFLRKNGGKAEKASVEEAVFRNYKSEFSKTWYQSIVGGNEVRWKKNTQFARNTARETGLIKPTEESGHGIWALTDTGWKWKFD